MRCILDETSLVENILNLAQLNSDIGELEFMDCKYVSYLQVNEYLSLVVKNKLLEHNRRDRTYKITAKGVAFLKTLKELNRLIDLVD